MGIIKELALHNKILPASEQDSVLAVTELSDWFSRLENCIIAFSGGVDSSVLASVAVKVLGNKAFAVLSASSSMAGSEEDFAEQMANEIGIRLIRVVQDDLGTEGYVRNQINRCYFCRANLSEQVKKVAKELQIKTLVDGTHMDDMASPRPGVKALREAGFRAPYVELGFGKQTIRAMARNLQLSNWERPSEACLSSRIAFGQPIDWTTLRKIEKAEDFVKKRTGAKIVRVRTLGQNAIIEVDKESIPTVLSSLEELRIGLHEIGYDAIDVNLEGYESGRMLELFVKGTEN